MKILFNSVQFLCKNIKGFLQIIHFKPYARHNTMYIVFIYKNKNANIFNNFAYINIARTIHVIISVS